MKIIFTGIVEEIGSIKQIISSAEGADLTIGAQKVLEDIRIGDSIAVSGPCLTVTGVNADGFRAWAMPETMSKTNFADLKVGHTVNLERAMSLSGRLGGHLVTGHIDGIARFIEKKAEGDAAILHFKTAASLTRYIITKGSVALDGVSLTVIDVNADNFSVGLIPHTMLHTTLGSKKSGDRINLEVDLVGKYVEKLMKSSTENKKENITISMLQEKGYI